MSFGPNPGRETKIKSVTCFGMMDNGMLLCTFSKGVVEKSLLFQLTVVS